MSDWGRFLAWQVSTIAIPGLHERCEWPIGDLQPISRINSQVLRQPGSASLSRLPSPERPVRSAMPLKECLWLDDDQSFTPLEEPGEQDHEGAGGSVRTSRLHLAFLKQSELFAKEQILGHDGGM